MVYVGKIYPVVAPSECHGGDTVSEIVVSIFIRLDLRTVSHTVSRTVSLYHCITVSRGKRGDTEVPYTHNIPPVGIETGTIRRWKYIRKANGRLMEFSIVIQLLCQMFPSAMPTFASSNSLANFRVGSIYE